MEFDTTYSHGAVDWNFPSPSATPSGASYNHNGFQTPKTSTFPSHFHDAFTTPQIPSYTPRQSDFATMTPLQRPSTAAGPMNYQYATDGQGAHPCAMPLSQQAGYATNPMYASSQGQHIQAVRAAAYDTAQMQTPPPTRGTSVKKPQMQQVAFGTPSTIAPRRFMTPQPGQEHPQNGHVAMQSPMQYPHLQFSPPQMYQFGNFGPASAPALPHSQIMWDQTSSPQMYQHQQQQPALADPFAPSSAAAMQWTAQTPQQSIAPPLDFGTPVMSGFQLQPHVQRPASTIRLADTATPAMTTASVDPSLVYSSPIRPGEESPERPIVPAAKPRSSKKPSANRKDSGIPQQQQKQEHKRSDTVATAETSSTTSSSSRSTIRPTLSRSNTTGHTGSRSMQKFTPVKDAPNRSGNILQVTRTASPLKRVGRTSLVSISESRRSGPSVVLTVDSSGRARAVRTDDSPSKSVRDRYPGLFDSDSSDDEQDDDDTMSTSASFSFGRGQGRQTKVAKLEPAIENLDGISIPRSASRASTASSKVAPSRAAIAAAAQLRRGNSLRSQTPSRAAERRVNSSASSSIDTAPMDISRERAQSIIGSADFNRGLTLSSTGQSLDAHNRHWSQMSSENSGNNMSPTHQAQFPGISQPRRLIRCVCGVTNDRGQSMVQCGSCTQWLHSGCVGLNPGSAASPDFTCFLCTKPIARAPISTRKR